MTIVEISLTHTIEIVVAAIILGFLMGVLVARAIITAPIMPPEYDQDKPMIPDSAWHTENDSPIRPFKRKRP